MVACRRDALTTLLGVMALASLCIIAYQWESRGIMGRVKNLSRLPGQTQRFPSSNLADNDSFQVNDTVYYLGKSYTYFPGLSLIHSGQGAVIAVCKGQQDGYVVVKFGQNRWGIPCLIKELSRNPPSTLPPNFKVGETVFYNGESQIFKNGDFVIPGLRGTITGAGHLKGFVMVKFALNRRVVFCLVGDLSRQPGGPTGLDCVTQPDTGSVSQSFQVLLRAFVVTLVTVTLVTVTLGLGILLARQAWRQTPRTFEVTTSTEAVAPFQQQLREHQTAHRHSPGTPMTIASRVSPAVAPLRQQIHEVFHGTSMTNARSIQRSGFRPSGAGCLGGGVYFAGRNKAARFGHDKARNEPAMLRCEIRVSNPKCVPSDDCGWQSQGYDSCFADRTSKSRNSEWCIRSPSQIRILEIIDLKGTPRPTA